MRLIDADNLKEDINSRFLTKGEKRLLCRIVDKAPTIARTERPLIMVDGMVIYITQEHIDALIEFETKKQTKEVVERLMNSLNVTCKGCIHNMGINPGTDDIYCEYIEDHNNNYRCEYYEEDNNNG